jgi:mono/diheme cytochrome c family protein
MWAGVEVMRANCIACHSSPKPKGGLTLFDAAGVFVGQTDYSKIHSRISSTDPKRRMPPNKVLTDAEMASIYDVAVPKGSWNPFED